MPSYAVHRKDSLVDFASAEMVEQREVGGINHGPITAKPSSCFVHSTQWLAPPTSPCPTLSADTEPVHINESMQQPVLCFHRASSLHALSEMNPLQDESGVF